MIQTPKSLKAFTLSELLITLGIFSIIMMLAIPSFSNMLMNGRMTAQTDELVNALNYARNTSLNQQMNVQVCPLGNVNASTCGTNWSAGWIIVSLSAGGASTLIQTNQSASTDPALYSSVANVTFDSHGIATTQSNFKFCDSRGGQFAQSVAVLATGFVQSGSTHGQAVWDNSALSCP